MRHFEPVWTPRVARKRAEFCTIVQKRLAVAADLSAVLIGNLAELYQYAGGGLNVARLKQDLRDQIRKTVEDYSADAAEDVSTDAAAE